MTSDDDFDTLIGLIYEAALDPSQWAPFMERLADGLNSAQATLAMVDVKRPSNAIVRVVRFDPLAEAEYLRRREKEDIWWQKLPAAETGHCFTGSDLIDTHQFLASPLAQDVRRTTDVAFMLGGWYHKSGDILGVVSVLRGLPTDDFSSGERAVLARVLPHLRRAMSMHRRFGELIRQNEQLEASLNAASDAVFVTDERGSVSIFNSAADAMLKRHFGVKVIAGRLVLDDLQAHGRMEQALRQQVSAISPAEAFILARRKCSLPPLTVRVYPIVTPERFFGLEGQRLSVVVISDSSVRTVLSQEVLVAGYGLTSAEARVTTLALEGKSPTEIAEVLARSIHTVRTQLKNIYARLGVRSQSELIARLMRGGR